MPMPEQRVVPASGASTEPVEPSDAIRSARFLDLHTNAAHYMNETRLIRRFSELAAQP